MPAHPTRPPSRRGRVADDIRAAIARGAFGAEGKLPSIRDLADQHRVAKETVQAALRDLAFEGLIYPRDRSRYYVRERPKVRRIAADRYQHEIDQIVRRPGGRLETSFTAERGLAWADYRLDREFVVTPATPYIAELLRVPGGTPLLERRFVFWGEDVPQQMSTSYYPLTMVAGTPVADPANEPWPGGNIAQLATLGIIVDRVVETTAARMPTPAERRVLRIPSGVPVFAVVRVMWAAGAPVEVAAPIVIPADSAEFVHDLRLSPPSTAGVDTPGAE